MHCTVCLKAFSAATSLTTVSTLEWLLAQCMRQNMLLQGAQALTNLSTFFASSLLFPCCRFSLGVFSIGQKWGFEVSMRFTPMASQSHFGEELLVTIRTLEGLKTDFKHIPFFITMTDSNMLPQFGH